ncbi:MAG: hypothetical protein RLZZ540_1674 [Bacteroidota bacterium]|jgi:hypothetical protein
MNRLVVIGNGFDLAHGLPTSYKHFIDDFWKGFKTNVKNEEYQTFVSTHELYDKYYSNYGIIENFIDFRNSIKKCVLDYTDFVFDESCITLFTSKYANREKIFEFKNSFFKLINIKNSQNWVDVENEYYKELKKIVKSTSMNIEEKKRKTIALNEEFEQVKNLLERYLIRGVMYKYDFNDYHNMMEDFSKICDKFFPNPIVGKENLNLFLEEFPNSHHKDLKKEYLQDKPGLVKYRIQFLCFNYTSTIKMYFQYLKNIGVETEINFIHGEIMNPTNLVNFGFGDEMDDDYKMIENIDDNEYLRNFKSFQYLQNSNYKSLLDFVESDQKFQVYIMGHSCGLSDRTMLNTIFEHPNCISIKVFYHEKK